MKNLIKLGALVNFPKGTTTPLHVAARGGNADIVGVLLEEDAKPNSVDMVIYFSFILVNCSDITLPFYQIS